MTKNGNKVVFAKDHCKIFNKRNQIVACASVINDLYRLNCNSIETSRSEERVMASIDCEIWHRRLGHISHENLCAVKNACNGIYFSGSKTNKTDHHLKKLVNVQKTSLI